MTAINIDVKIKTNPCTTNKYPETNILNLFPTIWLGMHLCLFLMFGVFISEPDVGVLTFCWCDQCR